MLMLPMFVAFGRHAEVTPYFILCAVVACLFSACAPAVLGAVVGTGLSALLSGFKGAKILRYVVLAVFALAIMAVSMSTGFTAGGGHLSEAALAKLDDAMASVRSFLPTVRLFSDGLTGDPLKLAAFIVISAALAVLLVLFAAKLTPFILARSDAGGAAKGYRPEKTRGVFAALFNREARLYFGSPLYLFNTGFSLLIMLIGAVAVVVFRRRILDSRMMLEGGRMLWSMLPYLFALFVSMCPITAVTISIEGPRFWIIRSMPVSAKKVLLAKLLLALVVEAAVVVVAVTILQIALPMDGLSRAMLYVLPLVYCIFTSLMGLAFNLRMPKLEWKNEAAVVKQSASVTVTMIVGITVCLIPMIVSMALGPIGAPIVSAALLIASVILFIWLFKGGVRRFNEI
jgi:ABC-2 type transport system permease protein